MSDKFPGWNHEDGPSGDLAWHKNDVLICVTPDSAPHEEPFWIWEWRESLLNLHKSKIRFKSIAEAIKDAESFLSQHRLQLTKKRGK